MRQGDDRLNGVLTGFGSFLQQKRLAEHRQRPHLVQRVREFLLFAREHRGYTVEQTLDLLLAEMGDRVGIKPWQVRQAADAVRIYRYQYRVTTPRVLPVNGAEQLGTDLSTLARLK